MRSLYQDALNDQNITGEYAILTVVDVQIMYQYSPDKGLRTIKLIQPDVNGVVTFSDGSQILLPTEQNYSEPINDSLQTYTTPTYGPYRRVISNTGYSKAEGYISLPAQSDLAGIDDEDDEGQSTGNHSEGAFNYFGVKRDSVFDCELGLARRTDTSGGWKVYHSYTGGGWDLDDMGPINDGSNVFLRMYVARDDVVTVFTQWGIYPPYSHFYYNVYGAKVDGSGNQYMRRVTSMVLHSDGKSLNNNWSNVYIGVGFPGNQHLWGTSDTNTAESTTYVTATETNQYYNESVDIEVDEY